jgi:type I restriction enzyme M protein
VATAILVFTRGGKTKHTWFYRIDKDGLSLDDKRQRISESDLPDVVTQWKTRNPQEPGDRKARFFFVPVQEIRDKQYDLSFNRYHVAEHDETEYEAPALILQRLKDLEEKIQQGITALEGVVG